MRWLDETSDEGLVIEVMKPISNLSQVRSKTFSRH